MISYNVPENQWTEKELKNLPAEDDRYEYKETLDVKNITKEVCAFANSFGGTLFLGIEDKNGDIKGVEKLIGRTPTTQWLEQIIPTKLEFRFGSFRIREVSLTAKTKKKIGNDKTVISVDVFDSDLVPYQEKQSFKYYRRENSSSKEAPHSYLAYLWGRNSSDKTKVIQHWVTDFLSPLILFVDTFIDNFKNLEFYGTFQTIDSANFLVLYPIDWQNWTELKNRVSGKQFLRTYNYLEDDISSFSLALKNFDDFKKITEENFLKEGNINKVIRDRYDAYLERNQIPNKNNEYPNHMLLMLLSHFQLSFGNDIYLAESIVSRYMTYIIFNFKLKFADWKDESFRNYCEDLIREAQPSSEIENIKDTMDRLRNNVLSYGENLLEKAESLRHDLCLRHNTIY